MVANHTYRSEPNFAQAQSLCNIRDYIDLASGYSRSNLSVIECIDKYKDEVPERLNVVSTAESLIRSHLRSLRLLKERANSTLQLVSKVCDICTWEERDQRTFSINHLLVDGSHIEHAQSGTVDSVE